MFYEGDLQSLAWKARTRAARWLTSGRVAEAEVDDFDWSRYHLEYGAQIRELDDLHTLRLTDRDIEVSGSLMLPRGETPLHVNHRLIYEFAAYTQPSSVLEFGCGGGDHLANLIRLLPNADVEGIDRSAGQLAFLRQRNPEVASHTAHYDLTLPLPSDVKGADLVFTQAVIMHIQTGNGHRVALWNALQRTQKFMLLIENWARHDFVKDLGELLATGRAPWPTATMYWVTAYGATALLLLPGEARPPEVLPSAFQFERIW